LKELVPAGMATDEAMAAQSLSLKLTIVGLVDMQ
jgi:hypothetical protein